MAELQHSETESSSNSTSSPPLSPSNSTPNSTTTTPNHKPETFTSGSTKKPKTMRDSSKRTVYRELSEIVELPSLGTSYDSVESKNEFVFMDSVDGWLYPPSIASKYGRLWVCL
ncbi:hypothetical protein GOBAR_DD05262 [Gossypium barbadense]|nr:hypothetical protein GOBAR_DD05262 [Gossypium barbadense]